HRRQEGHLVPIDHRLLPGGVRAVACSAHVRTVRREGRVPLRKGVPRLVDRRVIGQRKLGAVRAELAQDRKAAHMHVHDQAQTGTPVRYVMLAPAIEPAITSARPMYSRPVEACRLAAREARIASSPMPMGSSVPAPSRSQVSQPIGPESASPGMVATATPKASAWAASVPTSHQTMRRSGRGERLGVTRYQWPSSIEAATEPSAAAASTSWMANSPPLADPPATARLTMAARPMRPASTASPARGQFAIDATR